MTENKTSNESTYNPINKKAMKIDKCLRKSLRQRSTHVKLVESSDDSDQDYFVKKSVMKGAKWWRKFDHRYFKAINNQMLYTCKDNTTSSKILDLFQPTYLTLDTYYNSILKVQQPIFLSNNSVRVIFKKQCNQLSSQIYKIVSYQLQKIVDRPFINTIQQEQQNQIKILSFKQINNNKNSYFLAQQQNYLLKCTSINQDNQLIYKYLQYDYINRLNISQIDKQLKCWQKQLQQQNIQNNQNWQILINKIKNQQNGIQDFHFYKINSNSKDISSCTTLQTQIKNVQKDQQQMINAKKYLFWSQTLKYMQYGHADKTQQMLQSALQLLQMTQTVKKKKSKQQKLKILFETDCKICFCTQNVDKNKVLYCDSCNTSFHQNCYGVQIIKKQQPFYCQTCQFLQRQQKQNGIRPRKVFCQICNRQNFPMKNIDGHFYHITCLFIWNLAQMKDFQIQLKSGYNHQKIIQKVIQNQLQHDYCQYCVQHPGAQLGMQFICTFSDCKKSYHPICAYLNGCLFDIEKQGHQLKVNIQCSEHIVDRDHIDQIYLRRFFCDYKGTSNLAQQTFRSNYQEEQKDRKQCIKDKKKLLDPQWMPKKYKINNLLFPSKILEKTKIVKWWIKARLTKVQNNNPIQNSAKKSIIIQNNNNSTPTKKNQKYNQYKYKHKQVNYQNNI